jgi:uncharacterized protein YraI
MMLKTKLLGAAAVLLLSAGAATAVPAISRSDLNVRSGPGTGYGVVGVIRSGETVDVGRCDGAWCQVAFDGGSGYANRSYLQMAAGTPSAGVVVQAPVYDPYDYEYDYGYGYGPGVSVYAGPRFRHRQDGWRQGWQGGWQGRERTGNWQGRNWQGGDRGPRVGAGEARGAPPPGFVGSSAGPRVSAPVGMPTAGAPAGGGGARVGGGAGAGAPASAPAAAPSAAPKP